MTDKVNPPQRVQRKRTKGWKMPPNTVYVGRPTKWGNPYFIKNGDSHERMISVENYRNWINDYDVNCPIDPPLIRAELSGKNLACWCPLSQHCHADVLLEIANA